MATARPRTISASLCLFALLLVPLAASAQIVTAPGPAHSPAVRVIEANGADRTFLAYHPAFAGGVRVALGDVTGDGVLDIITSPGPGGGPHVRVWNGVDLTEVGGFFAYDPAFPGGVWVAAGDVNGDGRADIITGAGAGGGPHVRVWSGADFTEIGGFFAYDPAFPGGVMVAAGDVNGDGRADIVTGAGAGGGPHVRVWSGADFTEIGGFFAYHPAFAGGVSVAAGDVNGDGRADIITGAGPGGGPHVRVWSGATFLELGGFFAYDPTFRGGVTVGTVDLTYDGRAEILTGAGAGGLPITSIWSALDLSLMGSYFAYEPTFTGGVFVGSVGVASPLRFTSAASAAFTAGAAGTFTIATAGGVSAPAITMSGTLPTGVTFTDNGNRTATLAGTPALGSGGIYNLTFTANNGAVAPVTQNFTLTVRVAPAITSANSTTFNAGSTGSSFTVTTTGTPAPALSISGALPSGLTFTDNANGTGTFAGTAASGTGGAYALTITATNGVGSPVTQSFTLTVQQGASITSTNAATFTAGSAATFTVTTVGTPTVASITHTGALPSGVTFTNNGNGTATIAGTPGATTGGAYPITITASNGIGSPASQAFTLTVQQAPAITSANDATFVAGAAGTFTVTSTGFPTPAISSTVGLPAGVTFQDNGNGTATIAGTPNAGTGGSYAITVTAMNGVGSIATQSFTLNVQQAPAFASAASTAFVTGTPGTFTITVTGTPTPAIAQGGTLPSGVTYVDNGNGTATLAGTPGATTGATYNLTLTANNGVGAPVVQNFTLTVQQAPAITSAGNTTFTVGVPGTFTVTTTGFPTPTVARGGTLPAGVTFVDNLNGTGTLSGTPGAGSQAVYPLTFTASNGVGSNQVQNFTFTVACPAITLTPAAGALTGGTYQQAYSQTFLASGGTGHSFTLSAGALPAGLTLASNGALTGSPADTGTFTFTVQATDSSGCSGSAAYSLSIVPNAVNESFTGGVGNTQYVVAPSPTSSTPAVLTVGSVLNNDAGPGTLTASPGAIATTNGGSVAMSSSGAFVYTPAIGFGGPSDSFTYTLTDGNGLTDTATVTINLSAVVWYVNSSGGNGDGRSHNPFNTVTAAQSPSLAGHYIYVHLGSGTAPGTITLKANQTLAGGGSGFFLNDLFIRNQGMNPLLVGTITLASGVVVNTVDVNGAGGAAFNGTGVTGLQSLTGVNIVGGTSGVNLVNFGGNLVFTTTTSVSGVAGPSLIVNGGTGDITGRLNITSTAGRSVDIQNKTGGTVTMGGTINDTSLGVLLNNNAGATINFTDALTLNTGTNAAFTATGGGTINVTASGSTIVTTTGTALNISNTSIGSFGVQFQSISANGAVNGIVLNNTGSFGGLTVTGDGGGANNGSGGVIQNTTGPSVSLTNTTNVSLGYMNIANSGDDGIYGLGVTNFTLNRSNLTNNGNSTTDEGIQFGNPTGTAAGLSGIASITNTNVSGSAHNNVWIRNGAGTLASFTVANSTFNDLDDATGANSFLFETTNTATVTAASITGSTFSNNSPQRALDIMAHGDTGTGFSSTISAFTVSGNTFTDNGLHVDLAVDTAASLGFSLLNNTMMGAAPAHAINVFSSSQTTGGALTGRIQGNTIGDAGIAGSGSTTGNGVRVMVQGLTAATLLIDNNVIRQTPQGRGIDVQFLGPTTPANAPTSDVTVTNNDVYPQDTTGFPLSAIYVAADSQGGGNVTVRSDVRGNTVPTGVTFDVLPAFIIVDEVMATAAAQLVDTAPADGSCALQLASTNTGSTAAHVGCSLIAGPLNTPPLLADGASAIDGEAVRLTAPALDAFVSRALARFGGHAGNTVLIRGIAVRDLEPGRLGEAHLGRIAVDETAAGFGWFVDPTPDTDEEFEVSPVTGELVARADGPAAGKMDLLSALAHEAHHVFGERDGDGSAADVMSSRLPAGVRRVPRESRSATDVTPARTASAPR